MLWAGDHLLGVLPRRRNGARVSVCRRERLIRRWCLWWRRRWWWWLARRCTAPVGGQTTVSGQWAGLALVGWAAAAGVLGDLADPSPQPSIVEAAAPKRVDGRRRAGGQAAGPVLLPAVRDPWTLAGPASSAATGRGWISPALDGSPEAWPGSITASSSPQHGKQQHGKGGNATATGDRSEIRPVRLQRPPKINIPISTLPLPLSLRVNPATLSSSFAASSNGKVGLGNGVAPTLPLAGAASIHRRGPQASGHGGNPKRHDAKGEAAQMRRCAREFLSSSALQQATKTGRGALAMPWLRNRARCGVSRGSIRTRAPPQTPPTCFVSVSPPVAVLSCPAVHCEHRLRPASPLFVFVASSQTFALVSLIAMNCDGQTIPARAFAPRPARHDASAKGGSPGPRSV
ncbi:hypothetical protein Purlil1_3650 [Purpureocillium lilacinum]|uniref:Uncharacterized protein n=1 Tax=Purpureocillium lilacinum TaxID=33203 RepID=A0ABR0C603_PURLI|nr:hypothetical protein Purlil1_3650 [Purpureocillium lilacinum]